MGITLFIAGLFSRCDLTFCPWTLHSFEHSIQFTYVSALYDPFGVDVPLNFDITHSLKQPRNNSLTCTDCIVTRNFVTCQYCLLWIKSNRYFWTIPFWHDIALTFVPLSIAKPAKHGIAGENKWSTYNMHVNICELSLCFRKTGSESLCHNKTSSYSSRIYHPITPRVKAFRFCCYIIIQEVYTRGNRYK